MAHAGGRPPGLSIGDITRAGRQIGLADLSLNAVALKLEVTPAALYRHVANRWDLERVVGEAILADLHIAEEPDHDIEQYLTCMGLQLRDFILKHPGLASYIQTLFPRGEAGRRLLSTTAQALGRRGYSLDAAIVLSSAVASIAIGYAATEELQRSRTEGYHSEYSLAVDGMFADAELSAAQRRLPQIEPAEYVRLWLGAAVSGFVAAAPPGRTVEEIRSALDTATSLPTTISQHRSTTGVNHG